MKKEISNALIVFIAIVIFLSAAFLISQANKAKRPKLPYYESGLVIQPNEYNASLDSVLHKVSNFSFVNQKGKNISQQNFKNCVYVADYIFTTCPGICKDMSREMKKVYQKFEKNDQVKILSHTSKPSEDSVAVLLAYAIRQGVYNHDKWYFVTGNIDSLYQMALKSYLIVNPDEAVAGNTFVHTERVALIDKRQHIRGFYDGTNPAETSRLIEDIEKLLTEN